MCCQYFLGPKWESCIAGDHEGYRLYTMDHSTGSLRLDLEHKWQSSQPPQAVLPPPDQMCDDEVQPLLSATPTYAIQDQQPCNKNALYLHLRP